MTLKIQEHCYLDTTDPPTATYDVLSDGSTDWTPLVFVTMERALTGKLHVHSLVDGAGAPQSFRQDRITIMATLAQMLVLRALPGRTCYYVPNYHDDLDLNTYTHTCQVTISQGGITNIDSSCTYFLVQLAITDDEVIA